MKKLHILTGVLLILIVAVFAVKGPLNQESRNREKSNMPLLEQFEKEQIRKIVITKRGQETARVEKRDDTWISVLPEEYPAQPELVDIFYNTIKILKKETIASKNPEKALSLGVTEETGTVFQVFGESDKLLTHFIVGNQGGRLHALYVRNMSSNDVYEVSNLIFANIDRAGVEWRTRKIGDIIEENINTISTTQGKNTLIFTKNETWRVDGLENQDDEKVQRLVREVTDLMTMSFPEKKSLKEYGLEKGMATITVAKNDGSEFRLIIGNEEIDGQRYARVEGDETIFVLSQSTLEILLQGKEDFVKKE